MQVSFSLPRVDSMDIGQLEGAVDLWTVLSIIYLLIPNNGLTLGKWYIAWKDGMLKYISLKIYGLETEMVVAHRNPLRNCIFLAGFIDRTMVIHCFS